jgi:hypothetical protein
LAKHKQIGHADMRGDKGIAFVHRIVSDMGFVWNALHLEAGIDGIIEIRDAVTAEVTNCIIQVQSKAGPSYFKAETDTSFEFLCDERDLDYWMRGNAPVVLVVSRPDEHEAYWVSIKEYFRDPKRRKSRKIQFSKSADRFDVACRERLAALALPVDSGHYLAALPQPDTLICNLLPVAEYPKRLFRATTKLRYPSQVWERLNEASDQAKPEWLLHDGFLYAFHDLTFSPWNKVCLDSTTQNLATSTFAFAEDGKQKYVFVRMLGACLREILGQQGVRFSKDRWHYFFRSTPDFTEKKVGGLSVFKGYQSKTTPDRIAYYRHRAAELDFVRFDGQWFLQITPTYHFTQDGWKLSRYFDERLSGIKQLERQNKTHLRQLRMWEEVLRQTHISVGPEKPKQRSLFEEEIASFPPPSPYTLLSFDPLVAFDVDWNVPESAWLPQPTDDSDADDAPRQRRLFE